MLRVIVPFYNAGQYINFCLSSIALQSEKDFTCYVCDDISTDESGKIAEAFCRKDPRFIYRKNTTHLYTTGNHYEVINSSEVKDEDICITVDGDDWLHDKDVFKRVKSYHEKYLVTFGQFLMYTAHDKPLDRRTVNFSRKPSDSKIVRTLPWKFSHLRTFNAGLFKKIAKEDLQVNGEFPRAAGDLAMMYPLIEMAGNSRIHCTSDINYIYNHESPFNDDKVSRQNQIDAGDVFRQKKVYPQSFPDVEEPVEVVEIVNEKKEEIPEKHLAIIVPFYNAKEYIKLCLSSILLQNYKNYTCYVCDDLSTDSGTAYAMDVCSKDSRFKFIRTTEKRFSLGNHYDVIHRPEITNETICITVDGDDWLHDKDVFKRINSYYETGCWISYGQMITMWDGNKPLDYRMRSHAYVPKDTDNIRKLREWPFILPRTFKAGLFRKIKKADLMPNGKFPVAAGDLLMMFPMVEMAGSERLHVPQDINHVYNRETELNNNKTSRKEQLDYSEWGRKLPKYKRIESYN